MLRLPGCGNRITGHPRSKASGGRQSREWEKHLGSSSGDFRPPLALDRACMRNQASMNTAPTVRLLTLGCKVNQYETQYVKEMLELNGYLEAADGQPADLCVVNTCTVTAEGDAKSRQTV